LKSHANGSDPQPSHEIFLSARGHRGDLAIQLVGAKKDMHLTTSLSEITVRRWEPSDKASLLTYANNRAIWRNLTHKFPSPYTESDADFWINFSNAPSASLHLAIDRNGAAIGGIGITVGEGVFALTGEFGYWLAEPFWGMGIASAAGKALLDYAERNCQLARLEAGVFAWNPASMRVLEKLRFHRESIQRNAIFKDGQITDRILYARILECTEQP
jgi:ribosomal-protein-alanine N-acetyltransferase